MKQRREETVQRIKTQAMMCNYGLPENAELIGLGSSMAPIDACRKLKAIHELWVRLNLFIATGESSNGTIDFPEAKRRIEYRLNGKNPESSQVFFKSLVRKTKRR